MKTNKKQRRKVENPRARRYAKELLTCNTKKEARLKAGYSESVAISGSIEKNKSVIEAKRDLADELKNEVLRISGALMNKDLSKEHYRTLVDAIDKLNKNHQLLTGGATERQELTLTFDSSFAPIDGNNDIRESKQLGDGSI